MDGDGPIFVTVDLKLRENPWVVTKSSCKFESLTGG